jgi:hypothetical protein
MLRIYGYGFQSPQMARGGMCGLLVGVSTVLFASGNYQVRMV